MAGKTVKAGLGYHTDPSGGSVSIDVVADGVVAFEVSDISVAPAWAPWRAFELPLKILGWGFAITLCVGLVAVFVANPTSRTAVLLVIKELNPTLARVVDLIAKIAAP